MNRQLIYTILSAICLLLSSAGIEAVNRPIGTWNIFTSFAQPPQKVIDTENIVYYVSGGNLFSYNKKDQSSYFYTTGNKLTDYGIRNVYYNYDRRYLLIAYQSGNIDLLYDDGDVVNLSDIKDSSVDPPLIITSVAFDGDYIYVSANFGVVKFNEKRAEVVTSGIYDDHVSSLAVVGDKLVIQANDHFRYIDKNSQLNNYSNYRTGYLYGAPTEIWPTGDNSYIVYLSERTEARLLSEHTIDFATGECISERPLTNPHSTLPPYIIHGKDGAVYYTADDCLFTLGSGMMEEKVTELPEIVKGSLLSTYAGKNSMWSLTKDGIGNYAVDDAGTVTVLSERFKPESFPVSTVRYMCPSVDGRSLYVQNIGFTSLKFGSDRGLTVSQTAGVIDLESGDFEDITVYPVEAKCPYIVENQKKYGKYALSPVTMVPDNSDPSVYFLSTADDGVYKVVNGQMAGRYDNENSPIKLIDNRSITYGVSMDRGGNLWVMRNNSSFTLPPVIILPAEKTKLDPLEVKKEDWYVPPFNTISYWGAHEPSFLHCRKSNMVFIIQKSGELLAYDTRGTYNDFSDDRYYLWESLTDQDGNKFSPQFFTAICEDNEGHVWIGSSGGVVEIANPSNALNPSMIVNHVKVPRNDGSNLADYLLGTDFVMSISVDAANRKWIATKESGLFLVSATGNEIIRNFHTGNSPLQTDMINTVYASNIDPTVYIGTDQGLISYTGDATPARPDYSDVLVYPNPVRPEFRGDINITGLMDSSLIKIADASGNVVSQGRSSGGRFIWNGCNASGSRVKTGVYYVLMSQNASGSSTASVAKIMVVN